MFSLYSCNKSETEVKTTTEANVEVRSLLKCIPEEEEGCTTEYDKRRTVAVIPRPNNPYAVCDSMYIRYNVTICDESSGNPGTYIEILYSYPKQECLDSLGILSQTNPNLASLILSQMEYDASLVLEESEIQQTLYDIDINCNDPLNNRYYQSNLYTNACNTFCLKEVIPPFGGSIKYVLEKEFCGNSCCERTTYWCLNDKGFPQASEPTWEITFDGCRPDDDEKNCIWSTPCETTCGPK